MRKTIITTFGFILIAYGYKIGMTKVEDYSSKEECEKVAKMVQVEIGFGTLCVPDTVSADEVN